MKKENWLNSISKEDVAEFANKYLNLKQITSLEEAEDENYGRFFQVSGLSNSPVLGGWGNTRQYINSLSLGEYGPLDVDPYRETTVDDIGQLFSQDESLINIYLAWISLVAEKNQGKTIGGKTYTECFSNACNTQIDLKKTAQLREIESEATEKKNCVKSFVNQLEKSKISETQLGAE